MKYFKLATESDPKIIGVGNGIHQGEIKWKKFDNKNAQEIIQKYFSISKLHENKNKVDKLDAQLEYVEAYKMAKMTDFFVFTPALWNVKFFVSSNAKKVLEKFVLPTHKFFPVNIYQRDVLFKYWAFYIPYYYREDSFDFSKSLFCEKEGFEITREFQFKDITEFLDYKNMYPKKSKHPEKIYFNNLLDRSLDLFSDMYSGTGYYISEDLKNAIIQNKLTGFKIKEPKNPEIFY